MIPVCEPVITEAEIAAVNDCLRTGWISSAGKYLDTFEQKWAGFCGRRHGIAMTNGTVTLEVALAALQLPPGSEVILPTFTIVSCATALVFNELKPVLVDSDPRSWGMDVSQVAEKITPRTRAILVVHIYGHPVDMTPLLRLAALHGLAIVEDAAEVHGAEYLCDHDTAQPVWRRCGGFGELSSFSFYANKLITTGEGGMLLTDNDALASRCRSMRNLCFQPQRRFFHEELGWNCRMTNLQAALGVSQIDRLAEIVATKRSIVATYRQLLADVPGLSFQAEEPWARSVAWVAGVLLDEDHPLSASEVMAQMKAAGIETRPFFLGMHEQPVFRREGLFVADRFPVAERLARKGFYLPNGLALQPAQLEQVAETLAGIVTAAAPRWNTPA
jgi:perosamine synthetase